MNWIIPLAYRAVEEPSVRRDAVSLVFYEYVVQFPFRTRIAAETASIGVHHAASVIAIWRLRLVNGVWKYREMELQFALLLGAVLCVLK